MSFPHDSRPAVRGKSRTTPPPAAASDQDMSGLLIRRQAPRILVVDDNASIAGLMSQLLTLRGYEVVTAASAEQAEAEVRRQAPDGELEDGPFGILASFKIAGRHGELVKVGEKCACFGGHYVVMPGFMPGIHVLFSEAKTWMAGT